MERKPALILGVVGLIFLLVVLRVTLFGSRPDDRQQIREALSKSIEDSRQGKPGGVLDLLSAKFKVNQETPTRRDIADTIRKLKPDVTVEHQKPNVEGDTATIISPVQIHASVLNRDWDWKVDGVKFVFQKEAGTKYLVIPSSEWKLTDVEVPGNAIPPDLGFGE